MSKEVWSLDTMKDMSRMEVDRYHRSNGNNATINNAIYHSVSSSIDFRKEYALKRIQEVEAKKREVAQKRADILDGYSYADRNKGKFSRGDAKRLQELQEEERKLNDTILSENNKIKELEAGGRQVSETIKEIRDLAEQSLMFGHPRDPRFQSAREGKDETKLDFTNSADRVVNYQNQQAWAQNLMALADLLGPKVAKDIARLVDIQTSSVRRQSSTAIDAKKEELTTLLKKHGFSGLTVDEYRYERGETAKFEERPTIEMAVSRLSANAHEILSLATHENVHMFLEWPEEDKRALKAKMKEPSYANQVCHAIDAVLNSIGGLEGMDVPMEIVAKLLKMKEPYAKVVSKQTPEERMENERAATHAADGGQEPVERVREEISPEARYYFEMWRQSGTGLEFMSWCVEEKKLTSEELAKIKGVDELFREWDEGVKQYHEQQRAHAEATKDEISPEAYSVYDQYSQSGTGMTFENWCLDKGIPLPKGWEKVQEERFAGMKEYQKQQAEAAESLVGTIDPRAYAYYDNYSKSGSPLGFVKWCDEKGLEVPRGWEKIEKERLEGMTQYQEQQAAAAEIVNETIDPRAYAYYDAYSKSGSPLEFVKWCDEKGLDVPNGWQKIQAERFAGMSQYQEQQAEREEDGMGM